MEYFVVMITGSRHYSDYETVLTWFQKVEAGYPHMKKRLLHGGARGADTLGKQAASFLVWDIQEFPADWQQYGRKAGPIRNQHMIDVKPHVLIAFPLHNSIKQTVRTPSVYGGGVNGHNIWYNTHTRQ